MNRDGADDLKRGRSASATKDGGFRTIEDGQAATFLSVSAWVTQDRCIPGETVIAVVESSHMCSVRQTVLRIRFLPISDSHLVAGPGE